MPSHGPNTRRRSLRSAKRSRGSEKWLTNCGKFENGTNSCAEPSNAQGVGGTDPSQARLITSTAIATGPGVCSSGRWSIALARCAPNEGHPGPGSRVDRARRVDQLLRRLSDRSRAGASVRPQWFEDSEPRLALGLARPRVAPPQDLAVDSDHASRSRSLGGVVAGSQRHVARREPSLRRTVIS